MLSILLKLALAFVERTTPFHIRVKLEVKSFPGLLILDVSNSLTSLARLPPFILWNTTGLLYYN